MSSTKLVTDYLTHVEKVVNNDINVKYINQHIVEDQNGNPQAVYDLYEAHSGGRMDYYCIITNDNGRMVIKAPDDLLIDMFKIEV